MAIRRINRNHVWTACGVTVLAGIAVAAACEAPYGPDEEVGEPSASETGEERVVSELGGQPQFTPYTDAPAFRNAERVASDLMPELRDLLGSETEKPGAKLSLFVDEEGDVANAWISRAGGGRQLEGAELEVAREFEFTAAKFDGEPVVAWIPTPFE